MRIASLTLRNVVCFRGTQTLTLGPKAYGVVATSRDDARRSNWLGKSTLLEAVLLGLHGDHRWPTEDSWITHGEDEGGVTIAFDTGMVIERTRVRGQATRLVVGKAKGDEAQALVNEAVGLDKGDFRATCYFEQKRMSRFVVAKPSDRMDTVVGWLRLEKLEQCIDTSGDVLARTAVAMDAHQAKLTANRAGVEEILRANLPTLDPQSTNEQVHDAFVFALAEWVSEREVLLGTVGRLENDVAKMNAWLADAGAKASYDAIVAEGTRLTDWLGQVEPGVRRKTLKHREGVVANALNLYNVVRRDLTTKETLVRGQFDGNCPVAGIACPAKDSINTSMTTNAKLHSAAETKARAFKAAYDKARAEQDEAAAAVREVDTVETRRTTLREQAKRQRDAANRFAAGCPVARDGLQERVTAARERLAEVQQNIKAMVRAIARFDELTTENEKTAAAIAVLQREMDVAREGQLVFRRSRQRIAERALHDIERGANAMLYQSGIDLSLAARWQREGDGLADNCEACGAAFGKSRKVKVCPRCAEPRGPKMVNKLELVLSKVSGAAEDLAGGAFQLSASAWLRNARGCGWSVALIDEPFGAMDEANRDAFANHIATMLNGEYGFDQSLIVAHTPTAINALPGRIEIVSEGGYSTARVL